jgi:hypothetical protein
MIKLLAAPALTMEVIGQKLNFGHPIIASVLRRGFQLTQISLPAVRMVGAQ